MLSLHFLNRPWVAVRFQESVAPAEGLADLGVLAGASSVLLLPRVLCGEEGCLRLEIPNFLSTEVRPALGLGRKKHGWGTGHKEVLLLGEWDPSSRLPFCWWQTGVL